MSYLEYLCTYSKQLRIQYMVSSFAHTFRHVGGVEAERAERQRWVDMEHKKIMDSIRGRPYQWGQCSVCGMGEGGRGCC